MIFACRSGIWWASGEVNLWSGINIVRQRVCLFAAVMGSCGAARMDARPVIHASPQGWMIVALLSGSRDGWLDNRATDWPFMGLRHMGAGRWMSPLCAVSQGSSSSSTQAQEMRWGDESPGHCTSWPLWPLLLRVNQPLILFAPDIQKDSSEKNVLYFSNESIKM